MAKRNIDREYLVRMRETRILEYIVKASSPTDAMTRANRGEGDPAAGEERTDWQALSAEPND